MDSSPPGSSVHGILQARILEWVAIPFSRRFSQPRDRTQVSHIAGRFFAVWVTCLDQWHNKSYVWKSHSKHHIQWWKTESFTSKIKNKARMLLLFNVLLEVLVRAVRQEKEKKLIQIGKEKVKLSLRMVWSYMQKNSTKSDTTNKWIQQSTKTQISTPQLVAFLYTNNSIRKNAILTNQFNQGGERFYN